MGGLVSCNTRPSMHRHLDFNEFYGLGEAFSLPILFAL